jgi:hypothetical protein
MYLAAQVNERDLQPLARNASDVYWRSLVEASNKLAYHIDQWLPAAPWMRISRRSRTMTIVLA